ncbi:MAG TPA: signal peptidase I [Streptosporangiaceae bacterium]|nr:signal peptidase I [Streptosporangiaceae bacterium]
MSDEQGSPDWLAEGGPGGGTPAAAAAAGPAVGAEDAAGRPPERPAGRTRRWSTWRELPVLIVVALAIALLIKTFVVQPFFIPSSSMEDTLMVGDKVLVNKLVYHFRPIHRGDIIVFDGTGSWNPAPPPTSASSDPLVRAYDATLRPLFRSIAGLFGTPTDETDFIKRVIGLPGDHVACCNAQGLVTVNGVPLHESSYLYPGAAPSDIRFSITVPAGRLWVMGDNRLVSDDSRMRSFDPGHGTVPENEVIGRAFMIVWPPSQWRVLPIPATFDQPALTRAVSGAAAAVAPYAPLAAGGVVAVPLTWLQRRARRRLSRGRRARRGGRPM